MSLARKFLQGSVLNLFEQALRFAAVFVMTPIIVRALGDDTYGFWVLIMSLFGHYALLDFGLSFSLSHFFARAIGRDEAGETEQLVNTSLSLFYRAGAIAAALTLVAVFLVPVFVDDPARLTLARSIILIYGAYIAIGFPVRVFRSYLKSHLRYDLLAFSSSIQIIGGNLTIFYFIGKGHGLLTLATINAIAGCVEYALIVFFAIRSLRHVRFRRALVCRESKREILRYSSAAFVSQLGNNLRDKLDPIIIGSFVSVSAVTLYSIGMRFPIFLSDVIGAVLGGQLLSIFSQIHGRKNNSSLEESFLGASRISTVAGVFGGVSLIFYGRAFIERWVGPGYHVSYEIMAILTIPQTFAIIQYPARSLLYSLNRHRYLALTSVVGGIFNLLLSIVLARIIGIYGVVWATFIEMFVVYGVIIPLIVHHSTGFALRAIFLGSIFRPAVISLLALAPYLLLVRNWVLPDYGRITVLALGQCLWFGLAIWFLVLTKYERRRFLAAIGLSRGSA
jgi:O-antigen/teichoic acid export membrane protein